MGGSTLYSEAIVLVTNKCSCIVVCNIHILVLLWQVLVYLRKYLIFLQISSLTSMKKLKNSLELPNLTRNTRKFANMLMTDTSGEINLHSKLDIICHVAKVNFTITAEIHAHSLANFYRQYADRHMNLKFMRRVSERELAIRQFVIVKNKLISVFNVSILFLTMNFVITSK